MTFKRQLINANKTSRRIKKDEGGRRKNPMAKILRAPLFKLKVKSSSKIYSKFIVVRKHSANIKNFFKILFNRRYFI